MRRPIDTIPTRAMEALQAWHWPGNIRELENVIERSVILSQGRELQVPVAELREAAAGAPAPAALPTLEQAEREHILQGPARTGGKVGGQDGAAARLGLKRTTLQSRMAQAGHLIQETDPAGGRIPNLRPGPPGCIADRDPTGRVFAEFWEQIGLTLIY